jgi:hypothetical protein
VIVIPHVECDEALSVVCKVVMVGFEYYMSMSNTPCLFVFYSDRVCRDSNERHLGLLPHNCLLVHCMSHVQGIVRSHLTNTA